MKKLLSILLTLTMVMGTLVIIPFTASAETLDDHLITHWNFAGDTPWADKATNGSNSDTMIPSDSTITASDGKATIKDYANKANNHYMYVENSADLMRTSENRTFYMVFKTQRTDAGDNIVDLANQNGALRVGVDASRRFFNSTNTENMTENGGIISAETITHERDTWFIYSISYEKATNGTINVLSCIKAENDDKWITISTSSVDATQTWEQDDRSSAPNTLIFGRLSSLNYASRWGGDIIFDDIRIYDKALTADEVKSIVVTDEDPVVTPDEPEVPVDIADYLLTHWDFAGDDPLADKATKGNSDTIVLMNHATLQDNGTVYIPDNKNGTNNHYMYAENSADLLRTTEDRTIYIVFKTQRDDATDNIIELASQNGALRMGVNASKQFFNSTNSQTMTENGGVLSADNATHARDTWVTYSVSYEKDTTTGKVNVLTCIKVGDSEWAVVSNSYTDATQTWTQIDRDADPMWLIFGRRAANNYGSTWGGNLTFEDIRIYGMALNAEQVASIEITNPAPTAPVVEKSAAGGYSLSLAGDIGVNFFLTPNATAINSAKVTIKNGNTVLVDNASFDAAHKVGDTDDYKFTANVSAKEMADELTLTVTSGDTQLYTDTYSVKEYALTIINGTGNSAETVALVKAMLLYGGCAQTYFEYNTTNGYADGIGDLSQITKDSKYDASVSGSIEGLTVEAATLTLETKTQIVVALKAENGAYLTNYTFTGGTAIKQGDYIYITTDGICVQDLDVMQTITITSNNDATQKIEVQYSPMTFIQEMADNKGDTPIDTLVRAMYDCWVAAEAYIAASNA
ncbi:MAG: hypothetical protein IKC59_04765 [Clostridia bacterium]|nr:hypothetical protein [Clostridia bacterium]